MQAFQGPHEDWTTWDSDGGGTSLALGVAGNGRTTQREDDYRDRCYLAALSSTLREGSSR